VGWPLRGGRGAQYTYILKNHGGKIEFMDILYDNVVLLYCTVHTVGIEDLQGPMLQKLLREDAGTLSRRRNLLLTKSLRGRKARDILPDFIYNNIMR
jgi:hypothetical protein